MDYEGELIKVISINKDLEIIKIHQQILPINNQLKKGGYELSDIKTAKVNMDGEEQYEMKLFYEVKNRSKGIEIKIQCLKNFIKKAIVILDGKNITKEELFFVSDLVKNSF